MDAPSPERGPEILPRPRGIRAGKSAQRKRKAYQAYQLTLQPYRYRSAEEVPAIHQDKTNRPLYSLPGWKPDWESDEGEEELEEVTVEVEVDPLIPPSTGSAPSYHRLQRQPPPPPAPPIRPSSSSASSSVPKPSLTPKAAKASSGAGSSTPTTAKASSGAGSSTPTTAKASSRAESSTPAVAEASSITSPVTSQRLAPTPKIRPAIKAKASAVEPKAKAPAVDPKAKVPAAPKTPPKASAVDPKAKVPAAPKTPPKAAGPGLTDQPLVDLPRSVLLYNPDTFGRCNFRVEDSQQIDGKIIIYDFHNVLDRFFVSERAGRRATQHRIPYPNNAPELLADVQSHLKRVHRAAHEAGALTVICSHIGENSRAIENWALDTLRNTLIQSAGERQVDLVVITRRRTGRLGKLDICRRLFQRPAFLIIDDNTEICDEFNSSPNATAFHIQLPKRDLPQLGRSFSSVFEAEPSILSWLGN